MIEMLQIKYSFLKQEKVCRKWYTILDDQHMIGKSFDGQERLPEEDYGREHHVNKYSVCN